MSEFTKKLQSAVKGRFVVYIDAANLERSIQAKELPPALSHYFDIANFRSEFLQIKERSDKAKNPEPFGSGPRS